MDSLIFDLDGTLWDLRESVRVSWNAALKPFKEVDKEITSDDLKRTMGLQIEEIGERLFPDLSAELRKEIMDRCIEIENDYIEEHGGILYDNLEEVLKELSEKYKLFIVSNCQEGYIEAFYKYHKLEHYFVDFENPGRTGLSKGENIKLVIERNNLKSPVYVGDTDGDEKAAEYAGIPFVYASYGFGEVEKFDYKIEKFKIY